MSNPQSTPTNPSATPAQPFTFRVEPSPLLSRLHDFLPQLKAANDQLTQDIARDGVDKYSFENTEGSERTIQMNLSLGVLEKQSADNSNNNIAILPSQLAQMEQEKKEQQGELVLPWQTATTTTTTTATATTTNDDMNMLEVNNDDVDSDSSEDWYTGDRNRAKRRGYTPQDGSAMDPNELISLGGNTQEQEKDFQLSQQLFGKQKPITAAEAVVQLRTLGYEPVRDVSKGTDNFTATELSMCDDDASAKKPLVQEME